MINRPKPKGADGGSPGILKKAARHQDDFLP